jgi:hypothetical protein
MLLLGKLAKPATKVYQDGAFNSTIATAEYLNITSVRYVIGEDRSLFELRFGNLVIENETERFDILLRQDIIMTTNELSNWGADDSVVLDLIAEKIGTTIVEKVIKDVHYTY